MGLNVLSSSQGARPRQYPLSSTYRQIGHFADDRGYRSFCKRLWGFCFECWQEAHGEKPTTEHD